MKKYCPLCANEVMDNGFCGFCCRYVNPIEREEISQSVRKVEKFPKYSLSPLQKASDNPVNQYFYDAEIHKENREKVNVTYLKIFLGVVIVFLISLVAAHFDTIMKNKAIEKRRSTGFDSKYGYYNRIHCSMKELDGYIMNGSVLINPNSFNDVRKSVFDAGKSDGIERTYYNNTEKIYILSEKKYDGVFSVKICTFNRERASEIAEKIVCDFNIYGNDEGMLGMIKNEILNSDFSNERINLIDDHYITTYANTGENYYTVYMQ